MPEETEAQLLSLLENLNLEYLEAKRSLTEAKKRHTEAETNFINAKISREKLLEKLQTVKSKQVIIGEDYSLYDVEDSS